MNSVSLDGIKTLEDKLDDEQKVVLDELMKRLNKALPSSIHCRTTADVQGEFYLKLNSAVFCFFKTCVTKLPALWYM